MKYIYAVILLLLCTSYS